MENFKEMLESGSQESERFPVNEELAKDYEPAPDELSGEYNFQ